MLTNYQLKEILNKFDQGTYDSYYLALSNNANEPTVKGENFDEPTGMGYSRLSLYGCLDASTEGTDEVYRQNNNKEIHFQEATGDWGEIKWFGVFNGTGTTANLMYYGRILDAEGQPGSIHPTVNHIAIIRKGQLKIALKSVEE